jgi:hypothetical protein
MLVVLRRAEGEADEVAARKPKGEGSGHALRPCQRLLRRIRGLARWSEHIFVIFITIRTIYISVDDY